MCKHDSSSGFLCKEYYRLPNKAGQGDVKMATASQAFFSSLSTRIIVVQSGTFSSACGFISMELKLEMNFDTTFM